MGGWSKLANTLFLTLAYHYRKLVSIYQRKESYKALYFVSAVLILAISSVTAQEIKMPGSDSLRRLLNNTKSPVERADIMLRLAQVQIFKPGENKIDFDSATQFIRAAEQLNKSIQSQALTGYQLLTESYMVREKGQRDNASKMVERAIAILQSAGNPYYLGRAYYALGSYFDNIYDKPQLQRRITLVQRCISAFAQSGHIEERAFCLTLLADLLYVTRDGNLNFDIPINILRQALAAYDSIGHKELQSVYELLGLCYWEKTDEKHATQYLLLGIKTAQESHDTTLTLCKIYNTLATIYRGNGEAELAAKYLEDAFRIAIKHGSLSDVATIVLNLSYVYDKLMLWEKNLNAFRAIPKQFLTQDPGEESSIIHVAFMIPNIQLKRYTEAGRHCAILKANVNRPDISVQSKNIIYHWIARYYFATKQFEKSRYYLTLNIPITKQTGSYKRWAKDYLYWYKLDSAQGKYKDAFRHLLGYKIISDSIFNESKLRETKKLQIEYETSKKEDSIKSKDHHILLLTQKNDLQQANLRQANLLKNVMLGGFVVVMIILGLLYHQYKIKRQASRLISQKNEELEHLVSEKEWLLKEVHHRVKNNLQTIVSLLELQSDFLSPDALAAVQASQNRIYATSLLHQKLYQDENVSSVDMSLYIPELIHYLKEAFSVDSKINFKLAVVSIELDVSQAIPLGLIINESITNSIKYAFKTSFAEPEVKVSLTTFDQIAELVISDNGSGIADDTGQRVGLGLKLIHALAEDLDGHAEIESTAGTRTTVRFNVRMPLPRRSDSKRKRLAPV